MITAAWVLYGLFALITGGLFAAWISTGVDRYGRVPDSLEVGTMFAVACIMAPIVAGGAAIAGLLWLIGRGIQRIAGGDS